MLAMLYYLSFLYNIHHTFLNKKKLKNEILRGGDKVCYVTNLRCTRQQLTKYAPSAHPLAHRLVHLNVKIFNRLTISICQNFGVKRFKMDFNHNFKWVTISTYR